MRPPYLVCQRHCENYPKCKPALDVLTAYHDEHKVPHPIGFVLDEHNCMSFWPKKMPHRDDAA